MTVSSPTSRQTLAQILQGAKVISVVTNYKTTTGEQQQNWNKNIRHILFYLQCAHKEKVLVKAFCLVPVLQNYIGWHTLYFHFKLDIIALTKFKFMTDVCISAQLSHVLIMLKIHCHKCGYLAWVTSEGLQLWSYTWLPVFLPSNSWMTNLTGSPLVGV